MIHRSATRLRDRSEAGRALAGKLTHLAGLHPLVLALPRGGVPVGYEIAEALDAPLEPLFVKKIGAPGYEELAIGAVADGDNPQLILNEDILPQIAPSADYLQSEMQRKLLEIEARRRAYMGERAPINVGGRTVILVDDGIATGATVKAALKALRRAMPARLVLAVPVLPADAVAEFRSECDELVYLSAPRSFRAVGAHYDDFSQVDDSEVIDLLARRQDALAGSGRAPAG